MKAVILAGGFGTRISEETHLKPKPMVEIGGRPILWHILKIYSAHGINHFIICCGYKVVIKGILLITFSYEDVTFDMRLILWKYIIKLPALENHIGNTGESSMTGGRLKV